MRYLFIPLLACFVTISKAQTSTENVSDLDTSVYLITERMPKFPEGGEAGIGKFVASKMVYPAAAKEKHLQGTAYVQFIVEKDGQVSNVQVIRGTHELLNEEAVRVVRSMPKWEPAWQNSKLVRVQYILPVRFTLN